MTVLSSVVKVFALLALVALDATCADSNPTRHVRVEHSGDNGASPPAIARELQVKFGWLAMVKANLRYQPTGDKLLEYLRQIKEKLQRADG
ncbi:hypothetical protein PHYPSEUDO_012095 [Phytophthora pseudosyringae]|uniref:RxLR effector protein n=1 Tax=Phytophthora pseudosyringae TaxID=221518 RepID=A0A8T1W8Q8_9STRA|nr:hypothetical protein PHYPSEUDO_012095 [Phytophthora pseudosyringae]